MMHLHHLTLYHHAGILALLGTVVKLCDQSHTKYWKHFQLRKTAGMLQIPFGIHEPLEAHAEFTH